jgi:hypothetical protein
LEQVTPNSFYVENIEKDKLPEVINVRRLRKYLGGKEEEGISDHVVEEYIEFEEYSVSKIIGKKCKKINGVNTLFYKVRWKNYGVEYDTWEPLENVENCKAAIEDYEILWKKRQKKRQ